MVILEDQSSSDDVCPYSGGITSQDQCHCANRRFVAKIEQCIALGDNEYGAMIGNPRNGHGHLKDVAEVDDPQTACLFSP